MMIDSRSDDKPRPWKWLCLGVAVVAVCCLRRPAPPPPAGGNLREAAQLFQRASSGPCIRGSEFVQGMRALLPWLDRLGVARMLEVNINKLEKKGVHQRSLDDVLDVERRNANRGDDSATVAALWTGRVLEFMGEFINMLVASDLATEPLASIARQAYEATLMRHHGAFLRRAARALFAVIPDHVALFEGKLGYPRDKWATHLRPDLVDMARALQLLLNKLRVALEKNHILL